MVTKIDFLFLVGTLFTLSCTSKEVNSSDIYNGATNVNGQVANSYGYDQMITFEQLPNNAKEFINTHFPNKQILYVKKDYDDMVWQDYDVQFTDGTELEFDKSGDWSSVDMKFLSAVPSVIIPASINQYVNANYSGAFIYDIDKELWGYDVKISNGIELKFNISGQFLGMEIDD